MAEKEKTVFGENNKHMVCPFVEKLSFWDLVRSWKDQNEKIGTELVELTAQQEDCMQTPLLKV